MELQKTVDSVLAQMNLKEITNDDEYKLTGEWLVKVKQTEKMVDEVYNPIKKELNDKKKAIMAEIKRYKEPLQKAESIIKAQRVKYKLIQEEKARKEREEMLKLMQTDEEKAVIDEIVPAKQEEVSGVYHVTVWKYEIEDVAKIPREYMIPNEAKIRKVVNSMCDSVNIPGVKVYSVVQERVRA